MTCIKACILKCIMTCIMIQIRTSAFIIKPYNWNYIQNDHLIELCFNLHRDLEKNLNNYLHFEHLMNCIVTLIIDSDFHHDLLYDLHNGLHNDLHRFKME